jgi:hypothetical protein
MENHAPLRYNNPITNIRRKEPSVTISRQVQRAEDRRSKKEDDRLAKQLDLSDFTYLANDPHMTFSAMAPHLVDFMKATGLPSLLKEHISIEKRASTYSSDTLSILLILQNIMGYERIEGSRVLNQDAILKRKLGIDRYPDPETFRDELEKYQEEHTDQLFVVNTKLLDVLCKVTDPRYIDLHYDAKVITVYGDQENAEVGYNPYKPGRKSYHCKICTIEPFGFVLALRLESGESVSATGFTEFHEQCLAAIPQHHFVVHTVRLDRGFFGEGIIETLEGDCLFFEVVAKKYSSIKRILSAIPEEDFEPFYPGGTILGTSFSFCLDTWVHPRDFIVVKKLVGHEKHAQGSLFPRWEYQVICHNQIDMTPKAVWEDYNQRAQIELTIRDLDYDHFITSVPTGKFFSNYAYFWHCVLSFNLTLIFKNFVLTGQWQKAKLSTLRKKLINIPGRLVNNSGAMIMRLMAGFPFADILNSMREQILSFWRRIHIVPVQY